METTRHSIVKELYSLEKEIEKILIDLKLCKSIEFLKNKTKKLILNPLFFPISVDSCMRLR